MQLVKSLGTLFIIVAIVSALAFAAVVAAVQSAVTLDHAITILDESDLAIGLDECDLAAVDWCF